ncbi:MAG: hypothetical protein II250_02025 [Agathobacter sp.]|nr:hypothetical protein [Agathobacter sp.]
MIETYWVLEYVKVLLGYGFIMFLWPSVVFKHFLKGKSLSFRFSFCVTFQILLVNTLVLMLGLVHLLNPWILRIIFWGIFLWGLFRDVKVGKEEGRVVKNLLEGTYGRKNFMVHCLESIGSTLRRAKKSFFAMMKGRWWEYIVLAVVVIFGMIYFTYGSFSDYSYGFGDMYTHSSWIYGLLQGKAFSDGVYPEAMHCFIYGLHVLFGIELYSIQLFLAGIHVVVFLLGAYILLKEVFHWKYSPVFALTLFLTIDVVCVDEVFSMSRLQWTLPQEFGLFTQFLCAAYLIKYLRYSKPFTRKEKQTKGHWDENLLVFMLSLGASLAIHFYSTIMAFFLCVSFVPFLLKRIFSRKHFLPLVAAVLAGVMIAVVPMVGALATGTPFQGSIGWAMSVIEGTAKENQTNGLQEEEQNSQEDNSQGAGTSEQDSTEGTGSGTGDGAESGTGTGDGSGTGTGDGTAAGAGSGTGDGTGVGSGTGAGTGVGSGTGDGTGVGSGTGTETGSGKGRLAVLKDKVIETLKFKGDRLYRYGYEMLYKTDRANWIIGFTLVTAGLWLVCRIIAFILNIFLKKKKLPGNYLDAHVGLTLSSFLYMVMYCAEAVGLPALIAGARLCSTEQLLILAMMVIPVDIVFSLLAKFMPKVIMHGLSTLGVGAIYLGTMVAGVFHGYLYFELTRYNGAVMTTNSIIRTLPEQTYTIVSTTDELYQMIYYGWHEEVSDFLNGTKSKEYRLPTEYVFIYVEKKPIEYAQSHFFTGPKWLAWEKYPQYYSSYVSQCPDITSSKLSQELMELSNIYFASSASTYTNLESRTLVESQIYKWCQEFSKKYPYQMKTYYEDENFVCYYFKQNPASLYQLGTPEAANE